MANQADTTRLIADIGGTNARFALLFGDDPTPRQERILPCAEYPDPAAAAMAYLRETGAPRPLEAAFAFATAITGDRVKMTNNAWKFSLEETRIALGLQRFRALNDFTALAMSLPFLRADELRQVGGGSAKPDQPIALLGPGTGLGVSGLVPYRGHWIPLVGEGGHVSFSPANEREMEVLRIVQRDFSHVSAERLLNGAGLVVTYRALAELNGVQPRFDKPSEVTEYALNDSDPVCVETIALFCEMLGTAAGNLAVTLGAHGGVFIGGGIVPRLGERFERSGFRRRFEHKGRFSAYLAAIPVYVIMAKLPAFLGLAHAFDD